MSTVREDEVISIDYEGINYRPPTKLQERNVFSLSVSRLFCQSVCSQGGPTQDPSPASLSPGPAPASSRHHTGPPDMNITAQ